MFKRSMLTLGLAAGLLTGASVHAQDVVWGDNGGGVFGTSLDGSAGKITIVDPSFFANSTVSATIAGDTIYFVDKVDDFSGKIYSATKSGATWSTPTLLSDTFTYAPQYVVPDLSNGKLFWTNYNDDDSTSAIGQLVMANLDGSNPQVVAGGTTLGASQHPTGIQIDNANGKIYFNTTDKIWQADYDGSSVSNVTTLYSGQSQAYALELDPSTGKLYWNSFSSSAGKLISGDTSGSPVVELMTGLSGPLGVALGPDGYLYWGERGGARIARALLNGDGTLGAAETVLASVGSPFGIDVLVPANEIPEPATLTLLGLGGLAALRRRRQA